MEATSTSLEPGKAVCHPHMPLPPHSPHTYPHPSLLTHHTHTHTHPHPSLLTHTGDFYVTRHSNLSQVHVVLHLVTDETAVQSSSLKSRNPVLMGLKNCLRMAARYDIHNITVPLLLVHTMQPVSCGEGGGGRGEGVGGGGGGGVGGGGGGWGGGVGGGVESCVRKVWVGGWGRV